MRTESAELPEPTPPLRLVAPGSPRTILLRVAEDPGGWSLSLHVDDGSARWLSDAAATATIPADVAPPPGVDGHDAIREFVLAEADASDRFEAIGVYLHTLLHQGAVGRRWDELADAARPHGLRVLLDVPDALASLPWELMCTESHWLATDIAGPLVRVGRGFPGAGELSKVRWPLKILVVVGSEDGDTQVAAEDELINLNDAFRRICGQVDIEVLRRPSRAELRDKYAALRPHVFHFIGHGDVEDGRGRLLLHDPATGDYVPWDAADIRTDLRGWQPRLAILNACRSVSLEAQDGAWRVADAFSALGVPAVIAMQADIRGDAAAAFTGELYKALADHEPLDVAVARGRRTVSDATGRERRDFALPSLTVAAPSDSVLRMRFGVSQEYLHHVQRMHGNFRSFVDRSSERRQLWSQLDPEPDDPYLVREAADAIAITGAPAVGKSELARWCVGACELHGGNAAYVNLDREHRLQFLPTLRIIGEALADSAVHGERNARAFEQWSSTVRALEATTPNGSRPAADAIDTAVVYFLDALRDAAAGQPLLLALDHLRGMLDEDLQILCRYVLEPIAQHRLAPVRVILALSEEQSSRLTDRLIRAMGTPITLTSFKPEQFRYIVGHYLRCHFDVEPKVVEEKLRLLQGSGEFSWPQVQGLGAFVQSYGWRRYS